MKKIKLFMIWKIGAGLSIFLLSIAGCKSRYHPMIIPDSPMDEIQLLQQKGDIEFNKMHWFGWQQAAQYYKDALNIRNDPEIRKKFFYCCMLRSVRQIELEDYSFPFFSLMKEEKEFLSKSEKDLFSLMEVVYLLRTQREKTPNLPELIQRLRMAPAPSIQEKPELAYLYFFFLGQHAEFDNYRVAENDFLKRFPNHPLAKYLENRSLSPSQLEEILRGSPDFFELCLKKCQYLEAAQKYTSALIEYQSIAEHLPFWTQIQLQMGRLYLYLDDDEKALSSYEHVLERDDQNGVALFGKGVALSELHRLEEANTFFMMAVDRQPFFHGEAHYYLARNLFNMGNKPEARLHADLGLKIIPSQTELLLLSGILHIEDQNLIQAKTDFLRILTVAPKHSDALYFLAQIALHEKNIPQFHAYLLNASEGYQNDAEELEARRLRLSQMEISPEILSKRLKKNQSALENLLQDFIQKLTNSLKMVKEKKLLDHLKQITLLMKMKLENLHKSALEISGPGHP